MTNEAARLRSEIHGLADVKQRRRYPLQLRGRVVQYARARIADGASAAVVSKELDIGAPTLARFLSAARARSPFAELRLREPERGSDGLVVRGPCGVRVEGMSVDDVALLLQRLACSA